MSIQKYIEAVDCGVYGFYCRQFPVRDISAAADMLRHSCGLFSYLNVTYHTNIFPSYELEICKYLSRPFAALIEELPKELKRTEEIYQLAQYYEDSFMDDKGTILAEGYSYLEDISYGKIGRAKNAMLEYNSQKLFREMCSGSQEDYTFLRDFLSDKENSCFSQERIDWTEEQEKFCLQYPVIRDLAFCKCTLNDGNLFRCPVCGAPIHPFKGICHGSKRCEEKQNGETLKQDPTPFPKVYMLSPEVIHDIYTPGQLENQIGKILKQHSSLIIKNIRWPNMDTWDFKVELTNKKHFVIDAKMVKDPIRILKDAQGHQEKLDFRGTALYVFPNWTKKSFFDTIHRQFQDKRFQFLKVNQLAAYLEQQCV